jgi:hypothetical protein
MEGILGIVFTSTVFVEAGFCEQFEQELREGVEGSPATEVFTRTEEGNTRLVQFFSVWPIR